jgi:hypothetical protein
MRCNSCRWWLFPSTQPVASESIRERFGECHAVPPTVASLNGQMGNAWPMTKPDDWCGTWQEASDDV